MSSQTLAPARPLRADAQRNYDKIVAVAAQAFSEHGVQTSLDEIARRAGVGAGTLYRHFPTRDTLLATALVESRSALDRTAERMLTRDDAGAALDDWLIELAAHLGTYDGLPDSVIEAVNEKSDSVLCASCSRMVTSTDRLVQHAKDAHAIRDDIEPNDLFVIASSLAWAANKNGYSDADLRRLLGLLTAGIRADPTPLSTANH